MAEKNVRLFRAHINPALSAATAGRQVIRLTNQNYSGFSPGDDVTLDRIRMSLWLIYQFTSSGVGAAWAGQHWAWGITHTNNGGSGTPPTPSYSPDSDPAEDWLWNSTAKLTTISGIGQTTGTLIAEPTEQGIDIKAKRAVPAGTTSALWLIVVGRDINNSFIDIEPYAIRTYHVITHLSNI
jgi:hypothetical protein